ncbi:MAG: toprim domain-containing protein [Alphaproteobacteria bacterium]|nr:toprim domain-containing protein [Alphaproteobacteria bacterium]
MFHVASDYGVSKETIVICEGYATARSIAESVDCYVIAAMSVCNLRCVVEKIAKRFPNSKIVIAADNDEAGRKAAEDAKQAVNTIEIVYPTHECNDFNDLHAACGSDAVSACFKEVLHD